MRADQPRILVVEDEPAQREVLGYNLTAAGYQVTLADNGDEALLLIQEVAPDVIVLDCRSERDVEAGHYISPLQMDWLKAELAALKASATTQLGKL